MSPSGEAMRPAPPISSAGASFWEGTKVRRFQIPWCRTCDRPFWFPREFCPVCLTADLEWREASGRGTVYAISTMTRASSSALESRVPYLVALVELEEGPRMMTNIVGSAPGQVRAGDAVRLEWEALEDGRHLPLFTPIA